MFKTLSNTLINVDQFGHAYEFTYNKKAGQYKTRLGGFFSIAIISLLVYQSVL